jgi:hypothetical protein
MNFGDNPAGSVLQNRGGSILASAEEQVNKIRNHHVFEASVTGDIAGL